MLSECATIPTTRGGRNEWANNSGIGSHLWTDSKDFGTQMWKHK